MFVFDIFILSIFFILSSIQVLRPKNERLVGELDGALACCRCLETAFIVLFKWRGGGVIDLSSQWAHN